MPFTPKSWANLPSTSTPISAASLVDLEVRVTDYADLVAGGIPLTIADAKGDLVAATAADAFTRVAVGSNGQVLTADSSAPGGVSWSTAASGGIPATIVDTKGDLIAASAVDTVVRVPVGSNNTLLQADSSAGGGVSWTAQPQLTKLGIGVAPASIGPYQLGISVSAGGRGLQFTDHANFSDWHGAAGGGVAIGATRWNSLDFTARRLNFHSRITAEGTRSVADGWYGMWSTVHDRPSPNAQYVYSASITAISNPSAAPIVITAAGHTAIAGSRIAITGVAGTDAAAINTYHTVSSVSGNDITLPINGTGGTPPTGGRVTNAPFGYCYAGSVEPIVDRSIASGGAQYGDDLAIIVGSNDGSAKATDAFFLGKGGGVTGSEWIVGYSCATDVEYGFRVVPGAIIGADDTGAYGGAAFDAAEAVLQNNAHAFRAPNNGKITSRNFANTGWTSLIYSDTSDRVRLAPDPTLVLIGNNLQVSTAGELRCGATLGSWDTMLWRSGVGSLSAQAASGSQTFNVTGIGASSAASLYTRGRTGASVEVVGMVQSDGGGVVVRVGSQSNHTALFVSNQTESFRIDTSQHIQIADAKNIILNATTGTKIGTATSQKLGFYNATPIIQPSGIGAAATDAATTQTLANNLRTALINLGLVAA